MQLETLIFFFLNKNKPSCAFASSGEVYLKRKHVLFNSKRLSDLLN